MKWIAGTLMIVALMFLGIAIPGCSSKKGIGKKRRPAQCGPAEQAHSGRSVQRRQVRYLSRSVSFTSSEGVGIRTRDLRIKSPLLYQLSYASVE